MWKFKSLIILILLALFANSHAEALDIQYGTILDTKGSNILVQYYGIEKKQNYLCSVSTRKCSSTKKVTLGVAPKSPLPKALQSQLRDKDASHLSISPSGKLLAYYVSDDYANPTRTFTIRNVRTGAESSIVENVSYWDLVADEGRVFAFSPDSKKLVHLDDIDGVLSLYLTDTTKIKGGTIPSAKITTKGYQIDDFIFTSNNILYYVANTKENPYTWSLYRYDFKTKKDSLLTKNVSYVDPLRKVGSSIVFNTLQAKGYGPALYNTSTKKIQQFTIAGISTKAPAIHEEVIRPGSATAVLMPPTKEDLTKSYPVVIWLHGGPYRQASFGYHPYHSYGIYDSMLSLLQKNNIVVLKLDYRGSYGFGQAYAEGIKGSVGSGDVVDVMDAIAYIKNRYHTSGIYLAGNSYGGYLSLVTLAEHPEAVTSVMSINGVTDWESLLVSLKKSIFNTHFNGIPDANNRTLYDQASIVNKIGNISNQKIELVQGQSDNTIPSWQADLLYQKLQEAHKSVSIIKYTGEDHVFESKIAIDDLCMQMFSFVGIPADVECNN